jgi:hypothetical protein
MPNRSYGIVFGYYSKWPKKHSVALLKNSDVLQACFSVVKGLEGAFIQKQETSEGSRIAPFPLLSGCLDKFFYFWLKSYSRYASYTTLISKQRA